MKFRNRIIAVIFSCGFILLAFLVFRPQVTIVKEETIDQDLPKHSSIPNDTIKEWLNVIDSALHIDAFMLAFHDSLVFAKGDPQQLINLHSIRKPLISLLIGIAQEKGYLEINETLGEIGIKEKNVILSETEKKATIKDLLMARSGIYLDADAQDNSSSTERPKRGAHPPGTYYYYNNFDFNVLGTILEIKTGMRFGECLEQWLAIPLGMQDFSVDHVVYGTPWSKWKTQHPAYRTWMSARDLLKIGFLIQNNGQWNGKSIVSKKWIRESTSPGHFFDEKNYRWPLHAYGYLWHIDTLENNIWATGYGGQWLMIDTLRDITIVQRHYTGNSYFSQGTYLMRNTQSSQSSVMGVWYKLIGYLYRNDLLSD